MAVIRMGVFDVFTVTKQEMTATEIAAKTGADAGLVGKAIIPPFGREETA